MGLISAGRVLIAGAALYVTGLVLMAISTTGWQLYRSTGVWLGGYLYDHTGSYPLIWLFSIALGIFAGFINLPIDERAIKRASVIKPVV